MGALGLPVLVFITAGLVIALFLENLYGLFFGSHYSRGGSLMPEYNTVKIRKDTYELARQRAEKEDLPIMEIISKAIERYVTGRRDLEERARLLIKLLDEERTQASGV